MKTKNVFLAIVAFTFAVGSAFASMFAASTVYVWGKETSGSVASCIATNKVCTQTTDTSKICQVSFSTTNAGTQIASSTGTLKTFNASGCSVVLYDVADVDQTGGTTDLGSTIYELIAH